MPGTDVRQSRIGLLSGRSPLLRLQSDERLIALIRGGNDAAFDLLLERYRTRLLGFCRHMLGSREDAEDVLQEVFAASYNAIKADARDINVRPWLYRIARNRCLNHLRRPTQDGRDTMDDQVHGHGVTTADVVGRRADFRTLLEDIQKLPETQRTALLLREMDALSYEQIAEAMDNTVPSVKSLLVRARMSLAEAAEARQLTCTDVRLELAEVAEGLKKTTAPLRRHVRDCDQCGTYRDQLKKTSTTMALALPLGPFLILKKLFLAKVGASAAGGAASGSAAAGGAGAAGAGGAAAAGATAAGGASAVGATAGGLAAGGSIATAGGAVGVGAVATKAITVTAATALLAGGAVQVRNITVPAHPQTKTPIVQQVQQQPVQSGGQSVATLPPVPLVKEELKKAEQAAAAEAPAEEAKPVDETSAPATGTTGTTGATGVTGPAATEPAPVDSQGTGESPTTESGGASLPPPNHSPPPAGAKAQPSPGSTTPAP